MAQQTYAPGGATYTDEPEGGGWITFAGVMIVVVAILNIIDGIAAISRSKFFVANAQYVLSDLRTWGWIILAIGVVQLLVGFGVWSGSQLARWTGVVIVALNMIAQLLFIPAYPFWSLAIFALSIVIIHQISAHGTEGRGAEAGPSSTERAYEGMAEYRQ